MGCREEDIWRGWYWEGAEKWGYESEATRGTWRVVPPIVSCHFTHWGKYLKGRGLHSPLDAGGLRGKRGGDGADSGRGDGSWQLH